MKSIEKIKSGAKWNHKFYGNYIYLNGDKTLLSDSEKIEAINHIKDIANFSDLLSGLQKQRGGSNRAFNDIYTSSSNDFNWILNVEFCFPKSDGIAHYYLFENHNQIMEWEADFNDTNIPNSKFYDN